MPSNPKMEYKFSLHFPIAIAKFVWKMQKKVWYYEKWVGRHGSFPLRRSLKCNLVGINPKLDKKYMRNYKPGPEQHHDFVQPSQFLALRFKSRILPWTPTGRRSNLDLWSLLLPFSIRKELASNPKLAKNI